MKKTEPLDLEKIDAEDSNAEKKPESEKKPAKRTRKKPPVNVPEKAPETDTAQAETAAPEEPLIVTSEAEDTPMPEIGTLDFANLDVVNISDSDEPIEVKVSSPADEKKQARREKRAARADAKAERRAAKYGITEDYSDEDGFKLKIAGIVLKKRLVSMILVTVIFALSLSVVGYVRGLNVSRATMMLNYEQSVNGLAPNETRFNISDFTSDEVINLIIKNAGLENVITTEEMRNSITVRAVINKKPTDEKSYYIPTTFRITLNKPKQIRDISADNMLTVVCDTFSEYFHSCYTTNMQILTGDYDDLDKMEYSQVGSFFTLRIEALTDYLNMRNKESGSFKSEETDETFRTIKKMVDNLKNYNLSNYNSYVWENGVVLNNKRYVNTLNYLNTTWGREELESYNEYYIRREVIRYYNDIMATSILVPTINTKKNFYMARTKTGVDYLASDAGYYLAVSENLDKKIEINKDKLSKIDGDPTAAEIKKANSMIEDIKNELIRIEKLAVETDKEYNATHAKNYITFTQDKLTIFDRIPKKAVLVAAALFFVFSFYVYYMECIYLTKRGRKK